MEESMSISINGQSQIPPGFRFHPTEEELLNYYLMKKVSSEKIDLDVICVIDLNKLEPWDIQEKCKIGTTPQNDWYFFSHKDKKYPTGSRTNRATAAGFWKATGRDKVIYSNFKRIGMRKTLVFYKGRAPHGHRSDWIMHEYRLDDNVSNALEDKTQEDGWVICRTFKKKNQQKTLTLETPINNSTSSSITTQTTQHEIFNTHNGALDQILLDYMGRRSYIQENGEKSFIDLQTIEKNPNGDSNTNLSNWVSLDQFVASQLNGQTFFNNDSIIDYNSNPNDHHPHRLLRLPQLGSTNVAHGYNSDIDIWSFVDG